MKVWSQSAMLREAALAKHKPRLIVQLLIFLLVFLVVQSFVGLLESIPTFLWIFTGDAFQSALATGQIGDLMALAADPLAHMPTWLLFVSLLAAGLQMPGAMLYCRGIEGRSFRSMGLVKEGWWKEYLIGFALGGVMLLAAGGLAAAFGGLEFRWNREVSWLWLLLFLLGFVLQGAGEEFLLRGYFMVSLTNRVSLAWAVGISSVVFAAMHLGNSGMSLLAFLNLSLFGVFAGLYVLRRGSLWGACAVHSAWNWFQGNVLGSSVSGMPLNASVWEARPGTGHELVHGGAFGLEGGLAVTAVLLAAILLVLLLPGRKKEDTI